MTPARWPRAEPRDERLLVLDAANGRIADARLGELGRWLEPGDLLVVNDAATLPASLNAVGPGGEPLEVRLAGPIEDGRARAVLFGAGDWHTPTEHRPPPPRLAVGEIVRIGGALVGTIENVSDLSARLVRLRLSVRDANRTPSDSRAGSDNGNETVPNGQSPARAADDALWTALYRVGRPVQYSYLANDLPLWEVQTHYGGRPWAVEMPSAGRPLSWSLLSELAARGIALASLTHAAGLSATGDAALDSALPLPERYEIPAATLAAVARAKERGSRVIAIGTSVVRALEGFALRRSRVPHSDTHLAAAVEGDTETQAIDLDMGVNSTVHVDGDASARECLEPARGVTHLVIGPGFAPAIVDGLLTGMHEPGTSHWALMRAFVPADLLDASYRRAEEAGYLAHEFGDSCLILGAQSRLSGAALARLGAATGLVSCSP